MVGLRSLRDVLRLPGPASPKRDHPVRGWFRGLRQAAAAADGFRRPRPAARSPAGLPLPPESLWPHLPHRPGRSLRRRGPLAADSNEVLPRHFPKLTVKTKGKRAIGQRPGNVAAVGQLDVERAPRLRIALPLGRSNPAHGDAHRAACPVAMLIRGDSIVPASTFSPSNWQCGPASCPGSDSFAAAGVPSDQSCRRPAAESFTAPKRSDFTAGDLALQQDRQAAAVLERQTIEGCGSRRTVKRSISPRPTSRPPHGRGGMELGVAAGEQQSLAVVGFNHRMGLGGRFAVLVGRVQEQQIEHFRRQLGTRRPLGPSAPGPWPRPGRRGSRRCEDRSASAA